LIQLLDRLKTNGRNVLGSVRGRIKGDKLDIAALLYKILSNIEMKVLFDLFGALDSEQSEK
jgi:hypothetical protein